MTTKVEAVLVDTDVFSVAFVRKGAADPRLFAWREQLRDSRVVISFQTRAEVLAGALQAGWGTPRLQSVRTLLDDTPTVFEDVDVIDAYANLVVECRLVGHALHDRRHTADRWIASCAIAKELPLLAGDGIYASAPRLSLL